MKLPRVRLSIRRVMIAVAVLAVPLGGFALWRRSDFHRWKARFHSQMERSSVIAIVEGSRPVGREEQARLNRIRTAYHSQLRLKYERAASRPWASVAPDPPEPVPYSGPGRRVDLNFGE